MLLINDTKSYDIITEYLRFILNDNSINVLEEIISKLYDETIIHYYYENQDKTEYITVKYKKLDIFERFYKLKKIKNTINENGTNN